MSSNPQVRRMLVAMVVLGALAISVGAWLGRPSGEEVLERLALVWPDVLQMSQVDRAVIFSLCMQCHLMDKPPTRAATVQCLCDAARSPEVIKTRNADDMNAALELLIKRVPGWVEVS